ncbi:sugar transferase [Cohnella sp. 56]|uniref:sugar transferase n=1 Tax=Cohnella sp. 56 TaxID=3113722 RepID=UPI0030EAD7EB
MKKLGEWPHLDSASGIADLALSPMPMREALVGRSSGYSKYLKPILDRIAAVVLLVLCAPLMAVIYVCIRLESTGGGIFRQERIGLNGAVFSIYKFRTMHLHVPKEGRSPESESDPRVTRLGRILRKTSLDELPQLINILKGHMSFIGPRPEQKSIVELHYKPTDFYRFLVKPGITGMWQTSEDRKKPIYENLHHDIGYITELSFWTDLKIIINTIKVIFRSNTY